MSAHMNEVTQVYVVTYGEYSDYSIMSVWLTRAEAEANASKYARVEVWPIGDNQRTVGTFNHGADVDPATGEVSDEHTSDTSDLGPEDARVLFWPSRGLLGIRVTAETQERADKVYSEVRARVLADISTGLPPEVIADYVYAPGPGYNANPWVPSLRSR